MARIFFLAFDRAGQLPLVKKLRGLGHKIALAEPRYPDFYVLLKQQNPAPELFVADASLQASRARESLNYVRSVRSLQSTPIIIYNVRPEDEATTRAQVPGATILRNDRVVPAIEAVLARPKGPGTASQTS